MNSPDPFAAVRLHAPDDDDEFEEIALDAHFALSDAESSDDDEQDVEFRRTPTVPPSLALPPLVLTESTRDAAMWSLISPCSEPPLSPRYEEEEPDIGDDEPEAVMAEHAETQAPAPVLEEEERPRKAEDEAMRIEECQDVRYASTSDEEEEEVEVYNAEPPLRRKSSVGATTESEKLDSVTEADEMDYLDVSSTASSMQLDDSMSEDGSVASRPTATVLWPGRLKARTYSGSASVKMHQAYEKLRSRTLSAASTLRHSSITGRVGDDEDDGDFSSDDEDYSKRHTLRASSMSSRLSGMSLPTRISGVASVTKLPKRVPSFMRFRSSSSMTVSSDGSFSRTSSRSSDDASSVSEPDARLTAAFYNTQELKQRATAAASRAAGLLNAASAEAARKLKSARSFRSPPPSSGSSAAAPVSSPVVDTHSPLPASSAHEAEAPGAIAGGPAAAAALCG